jgi:DNA-binding SARP family transcriptional activator/WD40 repeat protein
MQFRVLGPLQIINGSHPTELRSAKQRMLLAALLCEANSAISADQLIDLLWGARPPRTAAENLRVYVYHLRRALGDGERIVRSAQGYAMVVQPGELDAERFEALAAAGQDAFTAGRIAPAADLLRQALDLWHGQPYAGLDDMAPVRAESRRLEERRQAVLELRIDADLMLGRHAELIAELSGLARRHPAQERFHAQLMLALYRAGRQAEALDVFGRLRTHLADELGLDPSARLRQLHSAILRADPALDDRRPGWLPETRESTGTTQAGVCPYPGLAPFDVADAQLFFGRERLVAEGIARLTAHRLLAMVGPSGSGKSSLARAGLLAELTSGRQGDVVILRPGGHPMAALAPVLAGRSGELTLLVDQCEEAFTECHDQQERAAFFDAIAAAAADPDSQVLVIVVLRADYYGHCAAYPGFAEALARSQILVGQMGEAELRRAIERPAGLAGLRLVEGLTDALVTDVAGQPGALPLLATALRELWVRRADDVLTLDAYVASGGIHRAVATVAERAYGELPAGQRDTARRILLRLAAPGDGATMVRRRVSRAELADLGDDQADAVVNTLAAHRLLIVADGAVEIAHEAVLEEWPRLRAWLTEDLAGLRLHRALTTAAQAWAAGGRDPEDLLRGARLAATLEWAAPRSAELTTVEADFLAASGAAAEAAARQAQARIAAQSRANRRLRWLVSALVVVLLGAIGAGGVAIAQRQHADDRTREAHGRELASRSATESDLDRALLLAVAGTKLDGSPAARGALLSALVRSAWVTSVDVLPEPVVGMTLTADDRFAILAGADSVFRLELATRQVVRLDQLDVTSMGRPAISPDGRTLALGINSGGNARIMFWDLATGRRTGERPAAGALTLDLAWRGDGRVLAAAGRNEVLLLDLAGGTTTIPFPGLGGLHATSVEYTPASLIVSNDKKTVLYDPTSGTELFGVDVGGPVALAPDRSRVLLGGGGSRTPSVLDLTQRRITLRLQQLDQVLTQVAWTNAHLIGTSLDNVIYQWEPDLEDTAYTMRGHTGNITGAAASSDGRTLYTVALDQRLMAWDLTHERGFWQVVSTAASSTPPAFHSDGRQMAIGSPDGAIAVVDTATGTPGAILADAGTGTAITALVFSPDGATLAASDAGGHIRLWDLAGRRPIGAPLPGGDVRVLRISPNGRLLLAGTTAGARIWEIPSGRSLGIPPGPERVPAAAFAGDDEVVLGGQDGVVELVRIGSDGGSRWRAQLGGAVTRIAIAGDRVLVGDAHGQLHGWRLADRRELWPPRRMPGGPVTAIAVDQAGTQVALSGGGDGTVHLWDIASGVRITDLPQLPEATSIAFDPVHNRLMVTISSGLMTRWDLDTEAWRRRACDVAGRELTAVEWAELGIPQPAEPLCGPQ